MKVFGVVYLILNKLNGKMYVGQTTKPIEKRFNEHANCKKTVIGKAIQKYGCENFRCEVLKRCHSKKDLDAWEKFFIAALKTKSPIGYNFTDGGEGSVGCIITEETRKKRSAALKGRSKSPEHCAKLSAALKGRFCGEEAHFFGRRHTPESLAKMSASKVGKHPTAETRAKMSASQKGRTFSAETRAKLSAALSGERNPRYGKKNYPEHQAKIVAANLGSKRTPETCRNISEALKGAVFPPSRCANISAAKRADSPFKNLIAELEQHQLSYAALAKLMDLGQSIISRKMRCCKRNFTERDKVKLEKIFGKPAEYLLEREEN